MSNEQSFLIAGQVSAFDPFPPSHYDATGHNTDGIVLFIPKDLGGSPVVAKAEFFGYNFARISKMPRTTMSI